VTWNDSYLEGRVLSAEPIELVCLLYQHALDMVHDARQFLSTGDIARRSRAVSRAIGAIDELDASLDHGQANKISRNLAELYQYMRQRLTEANLHQQDAPLAEAASLLATLAEAWNAHRQQMPAARAVPEPEFFQPQAGAFSEVVTCGHDWSA
jgi:flagellar secretion chaperone FliS